MSAWDPQQREWLQALGHPLWVLAGDETLEVAAAPPAAGSVVSSPSRPAGPRKPSLLESPESPAVGPSARTRTDPAAKAAALEAARMGAARQAEGPLREALLRATGQPPAVAARTLRILDVDQTALRDDPAAKRALWRSLRPLRKAAAK